MGYKVGDMIWQVDINYPEQDNSYGYRNKGVHIKPLEIVAINANFIVLNDSLFTKIVYDKKSPWKNSHYCTDNISVTIDTSGRYSSKGVFSTVYSSSKPTRAVLNKMVKLMEKEVNSTLGFFVGGIIENIKQEVDKFEIQ